MLSSRKRIFAGKGNLHAVPFCPFITDANGLMSMRNKHGQTKPRPRTAAFKPRPPYSDGK